MKDLCIVELKTITTFIFIVFALQCNAQLSDFKTVSFQKADSTALAHKNESLDNLPELSHKLTDGLNTDVERYRSIYMWVCSNIANDYPFYLKNQSKRQHFKKDSSKLEKWNNRFKKQSFKRLLKQKRTICTGYAYLVKKLSSIANLQCEIVQGYGKTSMTEVEELDIPNHTWNAIYLNKKWYLSDATWASGIPHPETNMFVFQYNNGFFFPDPKLFALNHYPVDSKWLLIDGIDKPSFETFLESPILYNEAYNYLNKVEKPKKMHSLLKENEIIQFRYELLKPLNTKYIYLLIDNGIKTKKINPSVVTIENNILTFQHAFKNKGFYDVHIYMDNNLLLTYTFEVEN